MMGAAGVGVATPGADIDRRRVPLGGGADEERWKLFELFELVGLESCLLLELCRL